MIAIMMLVVVVVMQAPFVNICACQDGVLKVTVRQQVRQHITGRHIHELPAPLHWQGDSHRMSHWQSDRANDRAMVVSHGGVTYL
jgi:hypothetical protein